MKTQTEKDMRKELKHLRAEVNRLRSVLIAYYRAEESYELVKTPQYYGQYREASEQLVSVARELCFAESKKRTKG